ncbi:MAG: hypothetical protein Kow0022_09050 [Phycisphaerales bacterium]
MSTSVLALFVVVAVLVMGAVVLFAGERKRREAALAQICSQLGLAYQSKPFVSKLDPRWLPFSKIGALKGGHRRVTWGAFGSIHGRDILAIEHRYVVSTGQVTSTVTHTCVACRCPSFWPEIELRAERVLDRLADTFGAGDLQLESERFNRRWRVVTADADTALAILTPDVQAMLEEAPRSEFWSIGRGWVVVCRRAVFKPDRLAAFLQRPLDLIARVPQEMLVE